MRSVHPTLTSGLQFTHVAFGVDRKGPCEQQAATLQLWHVYPTKRGSVGQCDVLRRSTRVTSPRGALHLWDESSQWELEAELENTTQTSLSLSPGADGARVVLLAQCRGVRKGRVVANAYPPTLMSITARLMIRPSRRARSLCLGHLCAHLPAREMR